MDKRIFGIETEFGISYSSPDSRPLAPEEVARYLFRKVVSWGEVLQRIPHQRFPSLP